MAPTVFISYSHDNELHKNWVIPVIRNNPQLKKVPRFLAGRMYVSFEDDKLYETRYEEVLRELLDEPLLPIPPLGPNPFKTAKIYGEQNYGTRLIASEKIGFHLSSLGSLGCFKALGLHFILVSLHSIWPIFLQVFMAMKLKGINLLEYHQGITVKMYLEF